MKTRFVWLTSLALGVFFSNSHGAEYLGVDAILARAESAAKTAEKDDGKDSQKKISADLDAFQAASGLAPKEAAEQWLALVQRLYSLGHNLYESSDADGGVPLDFSRFVVALPGPPAWMPLRDAISAQEPKDKAAESLKYTLQWYVDRLLGDTKALEADYDKLAKLYGSLRPDLAIYGNGAIAELEKATFQLSDNGEVILKILTRKLELIIQASKQGSQGQFEGTDFEIPDLVSLVGAEKASAFLKKALDGLPQSLQIRQGNDTRKLAMEIALKNVATLKAPQWELTQSLDGGKLYAALVTKFGGTGNNPGFQSAQAYELLRLLLAEKTKEAVKLSQQLTDGQPASLPSNGIEEIENAGRLAIVAEFFHDVLARDPNLPYWDDYIKVSVRAGESDQMMALLGASLAREDLKPEAKADLEDQYAKALLAVGKVDEGVAALLKITVKNRDADKAASSNQSGQPKPPNQFIVAEHIARIGQLLNRSEWIEQGIALAREALKVSLSADDSLDASGQNTQSLAALLLDLNRGPEAEAVIVDALVSASALPKARARSYYPTDLPDLLCALVGIYSAADRSADVLTLLERAPMWGVTDLSQIVSRRCYLGNRKTNSLGGCVAIALIHTGQKDKAKPILTALLSEDSGNDRTYELLLELDKAGAIPILDRLYAADPFQERPLIWKAKLLFDAGQLDEAEKVARQAIKVDPSDGEEGPGDRMRVYAVLADILEAKGKAADAKVFRGVVQAIRLSEDADRYYKEGLISQAIAMYEQSLGYFADAYCIQSRLAMRLMEQGDWKGAEEHYRRAYELMPDSFGRVESHCFGCERAFAGAKQQTLAERVFTKIAAERPDNPQVHYLLGYLRYEEERYQEALPEFQRAVELDPDYLNAWRKIESIGEEVHLPLAQRNATALNLIRLEPAKNHFSLELEGVTNLAAIWQALEQKNQQLSPVPKDVFPLKASADALAALFAKSSRADAYQRALMERQSEQGQSANSPGAIFSRQSFTRTAGSFLQASAVFNQ